MEVVDLLLADYASTSLGGKFTLVGAGFTEINTPQVPCVHPLMFLFLRVKATRQDEGKNRLELRMIGEKGSLLKADGELVVKADGPMEQHIAFSFQLANLKFEQAGDYSIEVRINGDLKQSQNLKLQIIEQPKPR